MNQQEFDILIISLSGSHPRKSFQEKQATRLNLSIEFLDATTPETLDSKILADFTTAWARPLRPTEVALTHSHLSAWKRCLKAGRPTLILEDDAILCASTPAILADISLRPDLQLVQLETFNHPKILGKVPEAINIGNYRVRRLYRDRGGAAAYLIWPDTAEKLIESIQNSYPPADAAVDLAPGIRRFQIVPAVAIQAMKVSQDSSIFDEVASIATSNMRSAPRPRYGSKIKWIGFKMRRLGISMRLFKRRILAMKNGVEELVLYTGE